MLNKSYFHELDVQQSFVQPMFNELSVQQIQQTQCAHLTQFIAARRSMYGPELRARKSKFIFVFQPGPIVGNKGPPWSSEVTSRSIFP